VIEAGFIYSNYKLNLRWCQFKIQWN